MESGRMPNLARLVRAGAHGELDSVMVEGDRHFRPQVLWPTVLTGMTPEHHGLSHWYDTYDRLKVKGIWDYFNARGRAAGIFSTPLFWPPPHINGFVIPAPHARDSSTWPDNLSFIMDYYRLQQRSKHSSRYFDSLRRGLRFVPLLVGPGRSPRLAARLAITAGRVAAERDREVRAVLLRQAKLDFSTAIFLWLKRRFDPGFAIFTSFEADYISHRYWRYHEPAKFPDPGREVPQVLRNAVVDIYAHTDRTIGLLVGSMPADAVVAVVSEHGMAAETQSAEIGRYQYMIDGKKVHSLLGLDADVLMIPVARWIAIRRRDGGPIDPSLEQTIRDLVIVESGRPLFATHPHARDELVIKIDIQKGEYGDVEDIGSFHVARTGGPTVPITDVLLRVGPTRSAMHTKRAMFALQGPGVRAGATVPGGSVTDIMPTLLAAAGIAVPDGLNGRVLDVFS
jgi:hypothetical protein